MQIFLVLMLLVFSLSSCSLSSFKTGEEQDSSVEFQAEEEAVDLSLKQRIEDYAEIARERIPLAMQETMISATDKLRKSGMERKFYQPGDKAPNFKLESFDANEYELYDLLEEGPVVLSFYRGGWCPYCSLELQALNEKYPDIKARGAELIAVSPEMPDRASLTAGKNNLDFPLLYDRKAKVAKKYNLVFELDDSLKPIYKSFGIDLEQVNGTRDWDLPVPATYVIGQDRLIKFAYADVDYKNRAEPADLLEAL